MMKKLLYITFLNQDSHCGGDWGCKRNLRCLQQIYGEEHITTYYIQPIAKRSLQEKLGRLSDACRLYFGGLTDKHIQKILVILNKGAYTDVFIDTSQLGILAKRIRLQFPTMRIYTFFHNIEYDYVRSVTLGCGDWFHSFWIPAAWHNERCACRYADKVIVLNRADDERLKALYGRSADGRVSVSMDNDYTPSEEYMQKRCGKPAEALFVGTYFPGNIKGLKWFCEQVLPETDIHLTIVGSGMEAFQKDIRLTDQITLCGFVEDLGVCYEAADFMVLPIVSGGGMKVKTAESLKYGKFIIGTPEALEGYEVNGEVAKVCRTKEEFVEAIKKYNKNSKYNEASHRHFVERYSFESALSAFTQLLR